jgi:hypothetical protein
MTDFSFMEFYPEDHVFEGRVLRVRARYGTGGTNAIDTKGGGANWEDVEIPYQEPLTVWRAPKEAYGHRIPLVLDGLANGTDVEDACEMVELMAGVLNGTPPIEPPQLILNGYGAIPHDYVRDPSLRWIIPQPPEWGEAIRRDSDGARVQQEFTVTFKVWRSDPTLQRTTSPPQKGRIYHARHGDTFEAIAVRVLKHANWGTRLANFNGSHNAREHLFPGQEVRLPDRSEERIWARTRRR